MPLSYDLLVLEYISFVLLYYYSYFLFHLCHLSCRTRDFVFFVVVVSNVEVSDSGSNPNISFTFVGNTEAELGDPEAELENPEEELENPEAELAST